MCNNFRVAFICCLLLYGVHSRGAEAEREFNIFEIGAFLKNKGDVNVSVCVDSRSLLWRNQGNENMVFLVDGGERVFLLPSEISEERLPCILKSKFETEKYKPIKSGNGVSLQGELRRADALNLNLSYPDGFEGSMYDFIKTVPADKVYFQYFVDGMSDYLKSKLVSLKPGTVKLRDVLFAALGDKEVYWYVVNNNVHITFSNQRRIIIKDDNVDPSITDLRDIFEWNKVKVPVP